VNHARTLLLLIKSVQHKKTHFDQELDLKKELNDAAYLIDRAAYIMRDLGLATTEEVRQLHTELYSGVLGRLANIRR
jgi:hypothetical protein